MRKILLTSLALAVAATPAVAHRGGDAPAKDAPKPPTHERPEKAKGPKGTHHLLHACVVESVAEGEEEVQLTPLGGNRHMKRVLKGLAPATPFTAKLDPDTTLIRLVGKARHLPDGAEEKRLPKIGKFTDLTTGDRVIVRFRVARDLVPELTPEKMPAAFKVIDRGPSKKCPPAAPETGSGAPETVPPADGGGNL